MKILEINSASYGSTGTIVQSLIEELTREGHECLFAYGRGKKPQGIQSYCIGNKLSVSFHAFVSRIFDCSGFLSSFPTKKLIKKIEEFQPDLIHLHNLHGYYINVKILFNYLKRKKIKVLWMLHDCWSYTGHCCYYSYVECEKWKNVCFSCPQKKSYPKSLVFSFSRKMFLKKKKLFTSLSVEQMSLVVPSQWLKSEIKFSFLNKYSITVIPSGVDATVFQPINEIVEEKKIILGVASVWDKRKGLDDFLELDQLIDHQHYQIVLIGLSNQQIKNMPKTIIGLKRTSSINELVEWYNKAYVFFNPSKEETQGLTTIEAIMCGTPVFVYNKTAIPEMVNEDVGIIVKDVNEVCEKLDSVSKISKEALALYREKFSKKKCTLEYVKVINKYLEY